ncbi:MAG: GntR family transcriptional regulator [Pyrinomonadaceae bacterium]|nr:GntR family transcriptional regulator [Pyrinomonadaceae bacterium]
MRLWLSKNSEIPLREQLARQIVLAIISGDLIDGAKLPSVREMAIRHDVHQNTVSAVYRVLEAKGWVESQRGRGVFVKKQSDATINKAVSSSQNEIDDLFANFLNSTKTRGFSSSQVEERLRHWLARPKVNRILLVENDAELRNILRFELETTCDLNVIESSVVDIAKFEFDENTIIAAFDDLQTKLPPKSRFVKLKINSVQSEIHGKKRPEQSELVGIVSRCETFLSWANTMLTATGIEREQLVFRDAKIENWRNGLQNCAFVITDSFIANEINPSVKARIFRILDAKQFDDF